jgi:hypothetical protein
MTQTTADTGNGMTVPEIRAEVAEIVALYDTNPDAAHGREDDLMERFVRWIALCDADPMAAELVKLLDADRTRWYA